MNVASESLFVFMPLVAFAPANAVFTWTAHSSRLIRSRETQTKTGCFSSPFGIEATDSRAFASTC